MIKIEIFGTKGFFRATEAFRNDLKDSGECLVEEHFTDSLNPGEGTITIAASRPNDAGLKEGIIKVVDTEPGFKEPLEPDLIGNGVYIAAVTLSNKRPTLLVDLKRLVNEFNRE